MKSVMARFSQAKPILDQLFVYVGLLDMQGVIVEVNQPPLTRGGYAAADVIGQRFFDAPWWSYNSEVQQRLKAAMQACRAGIVSRYDELVCMGNELVAIDFMLSPLRNDSNTIVAMLPTAVEISKRVQLEQTLSQREQRYRFVLESANLGFWDWDIETGMVERNARWAEMLGYTADELSHSTQQWLNCIHPDDRSKAWDSVQAVLAGRTDTHRLEYRMLHKDGQPRWILDQARVVQRDSAGRPMRMCGTFTDMTERKHLELMLAKQANVDSLTGLNNRRHFLALAEKELHKSQRYHTPLSLLMIDLDHFKRINDSFGHQMGDQVLICLAHIFAQTLREADIVGRLGGEEFAVLLPETAPAAALEVAERLRIATAQASLSDPHGYPVQFTISIGMTSQGWVKCNIDTLLSLADQALYRAKAQGRNCTYCITAPG